MKYQYIDVLNIAELPPLPKGMRYFDIIGGKYELRCFIVPESMSRGEFLNDNIDNLDECLVPIYESNDIIVRQDTSCALPGFYIIAPKIKYNAFDQMDISLNIKLFHIVQRVRSAMRKILNLQYVHLYYEEKFNPGCHVHFWLLPIRDITKIPRLYNFDIKKYMDSFLFSKERKNILAANFKMREALYKINLLDEENTLSNKLCG